MTGRAGRPVLEVTDLRVTFPGRRRGADRVPAVRGVGYTLRAGEVLGIVGESGSGKSVSSLAVMGLLPAGARAEGSARLHGRELLGLGDRAMAAVRGREIAMIFQDPLSALTPVYPVGEQVAEALRAHRPMPRARAAARAVELLDLVGIPHPRRRAGAFPHEFSGGMRQRVMIAMAIANDPDVIIADEPTTALDVTVQAQVLDALAAARRETGAAIVLITHDLGVVAGFADRVLVMYAGRPVESGPVDEIYHRPRMPYTMGLLGSVPRLPDVAPDPAAPGPGVPDLAASAAAAPDPAASAPAGSAPAAMPDPPAPPPARTRLVPIPGAPPAPDRLPPGCAFAPRCPLAAAECATGEPPLAPTGMPEHLAACVRAGEIGRRGLTAAGIFAVPPVRAVPGAPAGHGGADPAALATLAPAASGHGDAGPPMPGTAMPRAARPVVLQAHDLVKHHPLSKGRIIRRRVGAVYAVDGISFEIRAGETLGLVGESGSGKSTALLEILRLAAPQRGRVDVLGRDVSGLGAAERARLRRDVQVVFQDPMSALDPRLPVGDILAEPLRAHRVAGDRIEPRVRELLRLVGLEPEHAARFPHSFSGGQRQRIGIARALALEPRLLVLDEPVSALDVSIQAGVINLLDELKTRLGLSYLFVAHDLAVVRYLADRVAVMYLGRIAEAGAVPAVYGTPAHPYTQALLSAVPVPDPRVERRRRRIVLRGEMPSPAQPPSGCRFRTRCQRFPLLAEAQRRRCVQEQPHVRAIGPDHGVACHFAVPTGTGGRPHDDEEAGP